MITLVFCGDLRYCPYISRYTERLEKKKVDFQVVFWNRAGEDLNLPENYIFYNEKSNLALSKISRLKDFVGFYFWLNKTLSRQKPEKIILLSTLTGIFCRRYIRKSKCEYVYDIRDYSYEHIKPYYSIEKKLIKNSSFTAISSKGFQNFLPPHNYVIAHNFNRGEIIKDIVFEKKTTCPLKIVWNGVMRFFEYQKLYIDALKNDDRFVLYYHGDGPELNKYIEYCNKNSIRNVVFTGAYQKSDKPQLVKDADIINNAYGYLSNAGNKLKYAVSNRFYDGAIYRAPQFVEPEGYKTRWGAEAGIASSFTLDEHFADQLYFYYQSIDEAQFESNCKEFLMNVLREDDEYIRRIDEFCS